jgi:hypothetical protein
MEPARVLSSLPLALGLAALSDFCWILATRYMHNDVVVRPTPAIEDKWCKFTAATRRATIPLAVLVADSLR